jgi:hypothetical protein
MAGARLRHRPGWTVAVLAERLRTTAGSLDPAFGMSLQQLDAGQRRVFRLLGVLPGADFDAAVVGPDRYAGSPPTRASATTSGSGGRPRPPPCSATSPGWELTTNPVEQRFLARRRTELVARR